MRTGTVIVGGGLAGLALADGLHRRGVDFLLLEARPRLGGRILSAGKGIARLDLGPAWFWPGQPRMAKLVQRFALPFFEQYATGDLVVEQANGKIDRFAGFAPMAGSLRIAGGAASLVEALASSLPPDRIITHAALRSIARLEDGLRLMAETEAAPFSIKAERVILAVPPRLIAKDIAFDPPLAPEVLVAMAAIPTWMAGQAKCVAVYAQPFWRQSGLSGDAMSRRGPLVEIHDASPHGTKDGALFGFVGASPDIRAAWGDAIVPAVMDQLTRLFGPEAAKPTACHVMDWATETWTATSRDHAPMQEHPRFGTPARLAHLWEGRITLGSSEMAQDFGGYLEGALEIAETIERQHDS